VKTEHTLTGWKNIVTVEYHLQKLSICPVSSGAKWLELIERYHFKHRDKCRCCGHKYTADDMIYLAFTDKGNQHICQNCWIRMGKLILEPDGLPIDKA
jgi:hypothetical protein